MKNKILLIIVLLFLVFCFLVLFKGLNNSNKYMPKLKFNENLVDFTSKNLFSKIKVNSSEIFVNREFYILNIWASWCLPCINEHQQLMLLSQNPSIKLIGLNYKDDSENAKKFIEKLGNPYSIILTDKDGIISIELGAYGVPETYIINKHKKIIRKFIGPLNQKIYNEIVLLLK